MYENGWISEIAMHKKPHHIHIYIYIYSFIHIKLKKQAKINYGVSSRGGGECGYDWKGSNMI